MGGDGRGGRVVHRREARPPWQQWLRFSLVWGGILLFMGMLNVATYFAVEGGVLAFVATFLWTPLVGMLVVPSVLTAALLRGAWLRFAPTSVRYADLPAFLIGAVSAPLGLLALYSTGDPSVWLAPTDVLWPFLPTMLINGSVAGSLAHREMRLRDPRWWLFFSTSVVLGLLSWALLDPSFGPSAPG